MLVLAPSGLWRGLAGMFSMFLGSFSSQAHRRTLMKPKTKLRKLRALMKRSDVSAKEVARTLKVSEARVYGWLSKGQTAPIPETKLRLLELELSKRER